MMIKLRRYQQIAISDVRIEIGKQIKAGVKPSVLLESPTGSGKTAMAAFIAQSTVAKGGTVAFVCHRRELIDQTALTFDKVDLDYGYLASGYERKASKIQICSVGTLVNRVAHIEAPTVVIWDEAHHVGAKTWSDIRGEWSDSTHIGLTATPQRLDGKGLGRWFNALVPGPSVKQLMVDGFLSTFDAYAPVNIDASKFHKRGGDYVRSDMESALDHGQILDGIVKNWKQLASDRKTIGFAISCNHSKHIVQTFLDAGVRAAHLDAKSSKIERFNQLRAFAKGEIEVLFNVELFGEGFDLAANSGMDVNIEAVILARPTASLGLHLQQVGRALRPKPQPAIILDHSGNLLRHGFPEDEREWTLEDRELQPVSQRKICKFCFAIVPKHVRVCPECGAVIPKSEREREITIVEGSLEKIASGELTAEQLRLELREHRRAVIRAKSFAALLRIQESRDLPSGWAQQVVDRRAKQGRRF